jgi:hypothetical protein
MWGVEVKIHAFWTSERNGGEPLRSSQLYPRGSPVTTVWQDGWIKESVWIRYRREKFQRLPGIEKS